MTNARVAASQRFERTAFGFQKKHEITRYGLEENSDGPNRSVERSEQNQRPEVARTGVAAFWEQARATIDNIKDASEIDRFLDSTITYETNPPGGYGWEVEKDLSDVEDAFGNQQTVYPSGGLSAEELRIAQSLINARAATLENRRIDINGDSKQLSLEESISICLAVANRRGLRQKDDRFSALESFVEFATETYAPHYDDAPLAATPDGDGVRYIASPSIREDVIDKLSGLFTDDELAHLTGDIPEEFDVSAGSGQYQPA